MKSARWVGVCVSLFLFAVATATVGQNRPQEEPSWAPKPVEPTKWFPPNKPHTKLSEVKAKHKGKDDWREVAVSDDHLHAMPGPRRLRRKGRRQRGPCIRFRRRRCALWRWHNFPGRGRRYRRLCLVLCTRSDRDKGELRSWRLWSRRGPAPLPRLVACSPAVSLRPGRRGLRW